MAAVAALMDMTLVAASVLPPLEEEKPPMGAGVGVGVGGLQIKRALFVHDQESQIVTYLMSESPESHKTNGSKPL